LDFRKKSAKPLLKGAYINAEIYIGDDQLDALATIKSRRTYQGAYWLASAPAQSYFCTSKSILKLRLLKLRQSII
jgi:hypothetical protein